MPDVTERWNLNVHYHRVVHRAIPAHATKAVDIGCGQGVLAFELAARGLQVLGIDPDAPSIQRAKNDPLASGSTTFKDGDLFTYPFADHSFDVVASIAVLHHVDAQAALRRMKDLVKPGGVLVIVGFATSSGPVDVALSVAGAVMKRIQVLRGRYWEHDAPIYWPPPMSIAEMATLASEELPGCTFRRAMSNRYILAWHAPAS